MKKHAAISTTTPLTEVATPGRPNLRVGQALLDVTWRMATPVVICAGLGIIADLKLGTKPWLTIVGTVIGFVLAGLLVARLLQESEREEQA